MRASFKEIFSIDLRSLAVFRAALGGVLLVDLALRARDLVAHYTELGVLPRAAFAEHPIGWLVPWVSLHAHGPAAVQVALFVLAAVCAAALAVGFHARLAAFASWLLLVSLQNRNPLVSYGGDIILVLLLFWGCFLPLGARGSLDARRARGAPGVRSCFSFGSAGLLVQIAALHFFSALHKRGPEWIPDGSAIFYALHVDKFARPLGELLRSHEGLLRVLTWGSFGLELVGPLLLFLPWRFPALRLLAVAGFVAFHVGIGATLDLVLFSWISALAMTAFLPAWFWERAAPRLARRRTFGPRAVAAAPGAGSPPSLRLSRGGNLAAAAALAFVLSWNTVTLRADWQAAVEDDPVLQWLALPGLMLRLGQTWSMFAPAPPTETRWHVVKGVLADGREVDLLHGLDAPPSFAKPARRADYYPTGRWERLFANAPESDYVYAYPSLVRWYCARWNGDPRHETKLERVAIVSRGERTLPGGARELGPPRLLARQGCASAEPGRAAPADLEPAGRDAGGSARIPAAAHSTRSHATRAW
jgi:hypothetical protein